MFFFQDGVKVGPGSEGVLANFFNSLLSKKSTTAGGSERPRMSTGDKTTARQDAAAELEKMTRAKQLMNDQQPGGENS